MSSSHASSMPFFVALLGAPGAACSTIEGDGTTGVGGTYVSGIMEAGDYDDGADDTEGESPLGPEYEDSCLPGPEGTDWHLGWQITCSASAASREFVNPLDESFVAFEDVSGPFGNICCGGIASVAEADATCQVLCMEHICQAARVQHVTWAVDVSNDGMGGDCLDVSDDCGFDLELCMTGEVHEQVGNPGALFSYFLEADCEATHDQFVSPYGTHGDHWDWVQFPNDPTDDAAPLCAPTPEPEPGPPERVPENEVEEEPGTSVTLSWSVGGEPIGREQSLDAEVDLAYAVDPCGSGDCIGLSRLHVTVPDGIHQGLALENLHLTVEERGVQETPLSASGAFSFAAGSLRATLSLSVDQTPLVITGYNEGRADGVALPRSDTMTLSNLVFGFDDGLIEGALELSINGSFVRHAPDALIKVVDSPTDCALPVALEAASTDLDGEALSHVWWVPPWFLGTGNLLDATLPPGTYRVYLTSFDATGRFDSTARVVVRSCQ